METKKFSIGALSEFPNWEIKYDIRVAIKCPHCIKRLQRPEEMYPGKTEPGMVIACPEVIVTWVEGGYAASMICVECIKSALSLEYRPRPRFIEEIFPPEIMEDYRGGGRKNERE